MLVVGILLLAIFTPTNVLAFSKTGKELATSIQKNNELDDSEGDELDDSVTIELSIDKSTYKVGEEVSFSGHVSKVVEKQITIVLVDPNDEEIVKDHLQVDSNGNFKGSMMMQANYAIGLYILEARYATETESVAFLVEGKSDKISSSTVITLNTDNTEYRVGDDVVVSGQVSFIKDQNLIMQILDTSDTIVKTLKVAPKQDGSFKASFKLDSNLAHPGTYTVEATYTDNSATTTFVVLEQRSLTVKTQNLSYIAGDKVSVTGYVPTVIDGSLISIKVLDAAKKIYLSKELTPNSDGTYSFAFDLNAAAKSGTFTINVVYGEQTASTTFELEPVKTSSTSSGAAKSNSAKTSSARGSAATQDVGIAYDFQYDLENAKLVSTKLDEDATLIINIDMAENSGYLRITLPRELIDANVNGKDIQFKVLIDSKAVNFKEVKNNSTARVLNIPFPSDSKEIKIIGTPEKHKAVKTALIIDSLPAVIKDGEKVTFSGTLKTEKHGYRIQGATIFVKHLGPSGSGITLASGVTDSNGRFTVEWSAKLDSSENFAIFSAFDGFHMYASSQSSLYYMNAEK